MSDQTMVYKHVPHPRTTAILSHSTGGPVRTKDMARKLAGTANAWLAVKITDGVGTMWCAYVFAVISLIGLPAALRPGGEGIIAWIAQTFLQLVLLSIIIVGQNIAAEASDHRAESTYKDAEAILTEALAIQEHLEAQDRLLLAALHLPGPVPGGATAAAPHTTEGTAGAPPAPAGPAAASPALGSTNAHPPEPAAGG
ncbi:MAG: hypothetical protein M0Z95_06925 [Actinomycetota bacterium]|jgi:hypothetical protein|nr:hypothetical protein [Actinomycetota bacterium]